MTDKSNISQANHINPNHYYGMAPLLNNARNEIAQKKLFSVQSSQNLRASVSMIKSNLLLKKSGSKVSVRYEQQQRVQAVQDEYGPGGSRNLSQDHLVSVQIGSPKNAKDSRNAQLTIIKKNFSELTDHKGRSREYIKVMSDSYEKM